MNSSSVTSIPSLDSSLQSHVDSLAPALNLPVQVRNTPTSAQSNIAQGAPSKARPRVKSLDITDENFLDYLHKKKPTDPQPRVFRNITLGGGMHKDIKAFVLENPDALKFNGDTFIDLSLRFCYDIEGKYEFTNCIFKAKNRKLNWFKTGLSGISGEGTIIDGLYKKQSSIVNPVHFHHTDMRYATLKHIIFQDTDTKAVLDSDFSGATLGKVGFSSLTCNSPYVFEYVKFCNINATRLTFTNVEFLDNVFFTGAIIKGLKLYGSVDFSGASFDEYLPGNILLSDAMFSTDALIDHNLNSENNYLNGAVFFKSLGSIKPEYNHVRVDWAEQLVNKLHNLRPLSQTFSQSPSLRLSVISELMNICYDGSQLISTFIENTLLLDNKDEVIVSSLREKWFTLLMGLDATKRFDYQFSINQLIKEHPELQVAFYQQLPLPTLSQYIKATLVEDKTETSIHHIFYHADTGEALYIAEDDFIQLIAAKIAPSKFLLLKYSKDVNKVDCIPATPDALNNILKFFPAVLSHWMNTGKLLAPIIDTLFSSCAALNSNETERLTTIRNHINSLLSCKASYKMTLTAAEDENILHTVLSGYHSGNNARTLRRALVSEAQRRLLLADESLTDGQVKSMVSLLLARILTQLSSSAYCGTESDSPRPLRLLAAELLSDARHFCSDIVSEQVVAEWRELLVPQNKETFSCSAVISSKMAAYSPPGIDGIKIGAIMRKLHPLNR